MSFSMDYLLSLATNLKHIVLKEQTQKLMRLVSSAHLLSDACPRASPYEEFEGCQALQGSTCSFYNDPNSGLQVH